MTALLSHESQALADHEATIEQGLKTFVNVGIALAAIRDERLYRAEFGTFEDYAERRWGLSGRRAYQIMDAASSVKNFSHDGLPAPNESQARELGRIPEEQRADVWRETHDRTGGKPTAAAIRETWQPPEPEPEPEPRPAPNPYLGIGEFWDEPVDRRKLPDRSSLPDGQDRAEQATAQVEQQVKAPPRPPQPPPSNDTVYALARQEYLNAYSQGIDGLTYLEAYTNDHTPPEHIPDHYPSVADVVRRIESVLTTWKGWVNGR